MWPRPRNYFQRCGLVTSSFLNVTLPKKIHPQKNRETGLEARVIQSYKMSSTSQVTLKLCSYILVCNPFFFTSFQPSLQYTLLFGVQWSYLVSGNRIRNKHFCQGQGEPKSTQQLLVSFTIESQALYSYAGQPNDRQARGVRGDSSRRAATSLKNAMQKVWIWLLNFTTHSFSVLPIRFRRNFS